MSEQNKDGPVALVDDLNNWIDLARCLAAGINHEAKVLKMTDEQRQELNRRVFRVVQDGLFPHRKRMLDQAIPLAVIQMEERIKNV